MKLKFIALAAAVLALVGVSSKLYCPHMGGGMGGGGHMGGGMGMHGAAMHAGAMGHAGFAGAHAVGHAGFAGAHGVAHPAGAWHGGHGFYGGHGFRGGHREFRNGGWGWWIGGIWYPCDDPLDPYCIDPYGWWF